MVEQKRAFLIGFSAFWGISLTLLAGCASVIPNIAPVEGEVAEKIVEIPDQSRDALYIRANSWAVDTFVSAESVIEFQDKESGTIKGKYVSREIMSGIYFHELKTTITIQARDGRARLVLSDPMARATGDMMNGMYRSPGQYRPIDTQVLLDAARKNWDALLDSFEKGMRKTSLDW